MTPEFEHEMNRIYDERVGAVAAAERDYQAACDAEKGPPPYVISWTAWERYQAVVVAADARSAADWAVLNARTDA